MKLIEHSKNETILHIELFENEIGLGVPQSSIQQTLVLQEYKGTKSMCN